VEIRTNNPIAITAVNLDCKPPNGWVFLFVVITAALLQRPSRILRFANASVKLVVHLRSAIRETSAIWGTLRSPPDDLVSASTIGVRSATGRKDCCNEIVPMARNCLDKGLSDPEILLHKMETSRRFPHRSLVYLCVRRFNICLTCNHPATYSR
jgi:hypothetical protein